MKFTKTAKFIVLEKFPLYGMRLLYYFSIVTSPNHKTRYKKTTDTHTRNHHSYYDIPQATVIIIVPQEIHMYISDVGKIHETSYVYAKFLSLTKWRVQ